MFTLAGGKDYFVVCTIRKHRVPYFVFYLSMSGYSNPNNLTRILVSCFKFNLFNFLVSLFNPASRPGHQAVMKALNEIRRQD